MSTHMLSGHSTKCATPAVEAKWETISMKFQTLSGQNQQLTDIFPRNKV